MNSRGKGIGRGGGRQGMGGPQNCVCPKCDYKVPHTRGVPCLDAKCPKCGTSMMPSN